jgi:hypothetical protein
MRTLPTMMIRVLAPFAPLFSERVFQHVQVLLVAGAILAPGKRTVSSALRAMGLATSTETSIATTGCSVTRGGRAQKRVGCFSDCWGKHSSRRDHW